MQVHFRIELGWCISYELNNAEGDNPRQLERFSNECGRSSYLKEQNTGLAKSA